MGVLSLTRRQFLHGSAALAGLGLLAGCSTLTPATSRPTKVPRVGILLLRSESETASFVDSFRQGLREWGWSPGQDILVEGRYADGVEDRLPSLAEELLRLNVDVLVAGSQLASARAMTHATATAPIVMAGSSYDPVADGLVASLAHPGGNVTGVTSYPPEVNGKRVQLLKEILPGLSQVAILTTSSAQSMQVTSVMEAAGAALGLHSQILVADAPDAFEGAFRAMREAGAGALALSGVPVFYFNRARLAVLALQDHLPSVAAWREYADDGGLMAYLTNFLDGYRRAAYFVDRILKGSHPADLPIEQPTKFDMVLNLKTAQALGLTIPASVLAQATEVIQ